MALSTKVFGGKPLKLVSIAFWLAVAFEARGEAGTVVAWGDNSFGQGNVPSDLHDVVAVAAGYDHALALRADGTVVGWGQPFYDAATPPAGLSNVVAIAAGTDTSVALKKDGTAVTWGAYGSIPGLNGLVAIASGYRHTVGLRSNGTVVVWGQNNFGQATVSAGLSNIVAVAAGTYHSLALKSDGTVVGWGRNDFGQCNPPAGLSNIVAVAGGNYHSTVLKSDGTVVGWGANWAFSDIANQAIPPAGLSNVVAITAGAYHNLAAKADGTLVAWGWAGYGINTVPDSLAGVIGFSAALSYNLVITTNPFISVQPSDTAVYVGATAHFTISSIGNGPINYQWQFQGQDIFGATNAQLTLHEIQTEDVGEYRVVVSNLSGSVTSRVAHLDILLMPSVTVWPDSALVLERGAVRFQASAYGQLPLHLQWQFNNTDLASATDMELVLTNIQAGQSGGYSVVVTNDLGNATSSPASLTVLTPGQVLAWGQNWNGELDLPNGLSDVIALAAGRDHSLALRTDGTVAAWGTDYFGQRDVPAGLSNVVAIAAGGGFSLALQQGGTVREWGDAFSANISLPTGLTNVTAIAAGLSHALALQRDGHVVAWGAITSVPTGLTDVASVGAGSGFCLALRSNSTVVAWGDNTLGQCNVPAGLTNVMTIAAGHSHSLALRRDGTVVGWGANDSGQLDAPQTVSNVVAIAAGYKHSIALKDDGTLVAWGNNELGQSPRWIGLTGVRAIAAGKLSSFSIAAIDFPQILAPPTNLLVIQGGQAIFHVSATDTSALNYQWQVLGTNIPGATNVTLTLNDVQADQGGTYTVIVANRFGNAVTAQAILTVVSPPTVITAGPSGINGIASLKGIVNPNGAVTTAWFEWGTSTAYGNSTPNAHPGSGTANVGLIYDLSGLIPGVAYHYRLVATNIAGRSNGRDVIYQSPHVLLVGDNPMTNECHSPFTDPGAFSTVAPLAVAAGYFHSLALNADGTVVAWGEDNDGQIRVPVGLTNVETIAAGGFHSLALKHDGTVVGWGRNYENESSIPNSLSNVVAIAAGSYHSLALKNNGTVVAWGWYTSGQTNIPAGLNNVVAIAAGSLFNLALKGDHTVVGWGYNADGEVSIPAGLTNVVGIAAGWNHSLALKADGTVIGWGANDIGQTSVPANLSNVVAIAAGDFYSLALRSDGTVVGWGFDYYGQTSMPESWSNVLAIAAGGYHNLAITSDGVLLAAGYNLYGQTSIPANLAGDVTVNGEVDSDNPGTYTLTYNAVNSLGIVGTATRTVVVADTTPPTLVCPANLIVEFVSKDGTPVSFAPEVNDLCSTFVAVTCDPPSGSTFSIGTTPVVCTANDASGNSASCGFQVTVLGAQGVKSNVLTELIALRNMVRRPRERENLDEAVRHLNKSLEATLWTGQMHLTRKDGVRVFNQEKAAVEAISRLMKIERGIIPDAVLLALVNRIVKADRLLAVVAIQDATEAGADLGKIAELQELVAKGDDKTAEANYEEAIEHYKDAWHRALRLSTRLSSRVTNGNMQMEFSGFPGETYVIEASTNLTDWMVVKTGTIGAEGLVQFEGVPDGRYQARFYRVKFSP